MPSPPVQLRSFPRSKNTFTLLAAIVLLATMPCFSQDFSHPDTRPAATAALTQQANDALSSGDLATALKLLTTLNAQTPHNAQVLYDLGLTLEALGATAPTGSPTPESFYRASIAANPDFAPPHVALGLLLARDSRNSEASTQLLEATRIPGTDPVLLGRADRALARLDQIANPPDLTAASSALLDALKVTPEQPDDILLSAQLAAASSDLTSAEQAYRRYLAVPGNTYDPQATASLAHILLTQNQLPEAESLLVAALAHNAADPALTAQLAQVDLASGDPAKVAQAAPLVESLHATHPKNAAITRLLARIYLQTGDLDKSDALYVALIAENAAHPDPTLLDARAEILIRLRRPGEAETLLKQAVADPEAFSTPQDFADAALHLAFAAQQIDDPATTLQALALRAKVQPPSPSALFLEATANDDLHHSTQAAGLYQQFLAAAHGALPEEEAQARRRLQVLEHRK